MKPILQTNPCVIAYEAETGTPIDGIPLEEGLTHEQIVAAARGLLTADIPWDLFSALADATYIYWTPAGLPGWSWRFTDEDIVNLPADTFRFPEPLRRRRTAAANHDQRPTMTNKTSKLTPRELCACIEGAVDVAAAGVAKGEGTRCIVELVRNLEEARQQCLALGAGIFVRRDYEPVLRAANPRLADFVFFVRTPEV